MYRRGDLQSAVPCPPLVLAPEEGEDDEEKVHDVEVELEAGKDVLLLTDRQLVFSAHHLGVVDQELPQRK